MAAVAIKDVLGAVSLVFTILTFFVSRRVDRFDPSKLVKLGWRSGGEALVDLVLAAVAAFVLFIVWPVLDDSGAFGSFSEPEDVMPNLLAVIAVGFAVLALIELALFLTRFITSITLSTK
jgi:hypothetical protein